MVGPKVRCEHSRGGFVENSRASEIPLGLEQLRQLKARGGGRWVQVSEPGAKKGDGTIEVGAGRSEVALRRFGLAKHNERLGQIGARRPQLPFKDLERFYCLYFR